MSQSLSQSDLTHIKRSFISYLEGSAPLALVQEPLDLMLRVEGPIYFTPKDVAETVASWALLKSHAEGYFIHEYYISSIELIAAADHSRILTAFDPTRFYMPYFEGLVRSCPKEEKEAFKQKLKSLKERLASEWGYQFRRVEQTQTSSQLPEPNIASQPNSFSQSNTPEVVRNNPTTSTSSYNYPSQEAYDSTPTYPSVKNQQTNYPAANTQQTPPTYPTHLTSMSSYPIAAAPPSYPTGTLPPPDGYHSPPINHYPPPNNIDDPRLNPASSYSNLNSNLMNSSPGVMPNVYPNTNPNPYTNPNPNPQASYPTHNANTSGNSMNSYTNLVGTNKLAGYESIFDLIDRTDFVASKPVASKPVEEKVNNFNKEVSPESVTALVNQLRRSALRLNPQEQSTYLSELQRVFSELVQRRAYLVPYLETLIDIAIITFNAGQGVFGAQLLYLVEQIYYQDDFDEYIRHGLRRFRAATVLNEAYMRSMAGNPETVSALRIYLAHFDELAPDVLLSYLSHETDRQKQRFWMLLIEVHRESAVPEIIKYLSQLTASEETWPLIRNLISLVGRVPPQEKNAQRQAISILGGYLKSPFIQLRYATVTALETLINDDALPHIVAAFDEKLYSDSELEDKERLVAYLKTLISLIGRFNSERALKVLVDVALGKYINFVNAKSLHQLQLQAMQLLASKHQLLSANLVAPIIEKIRLITNPWKKLMSRFLGDDDMELLAMIEIVGVINTPEVKDLLEEVKGQYANQAPGRRAGELLARL